MRGIRFIVLAVLGLALVARAPALSIPPTPSDSSFLQDYGGLVDKATAQAIGEAQREAYERYDTPIVVVTVPSMATYGGQGGSIEGFARAWFDAWKIGKRAADGRVLNKGMLLLVSVGDRRARIELGADWGRLWDGQCETIMNDRIVPAFRRGDFAGGILAGTQALRDLAKRGPGAEQPSGPIDWTGGREVVSTTPLKSNPLIIATVIGVALIVLSFFFPDHRKLLLYFGLGIIAVAWLLWLFLALLLLLFGGRGRSGGGFRSSGGFGGGFSGGGGASGSW